MSTANMSIDPSKARAITDYLAANPDASNRDAAATLGVHESAVRRAKAARGVMVELGLSVVRTDGGTQFREAVNEDVALEYAEAYKAGDRLPAPVAFEDGNGDIWLGDGFTRVRAAGLAGLDRLEFELRKGSLDDAILYAAGANERHGQRRTKADRERAIFAAYKLMPNATNEQIGKVCNVSRETVRKLLHGDAFRLKPDPLPPENQFIQNDKLVEPHKPAKNQPEFFPDPVEYDRQQKDKHAQDLGFDDHEDMESEDRNLGWTADNAHARQVVESLSGGIDSIVDGIGTFDGPLSLSGIEVEETTHDGGPIDEFASWLASLPMNGKLQGHALTKFNADAQFYWAFTKSPEFKAFEQHIAKFTKNRAAGVTYFALDRFRKSLVHPRDWKLCPSCSGEGKTDGLDRIQSCQSCHGRGYHA